MSDIEARLRLAFHWRMNFLRGAYHALTPPERRGLQDGQGRLKVVRLAGIAPTTYFAAPALLVRLNQQQVDTLVDGAVARIHQQFFGGGDAAASATGNGIVAIGEGEFCSRVIDCLVAALAVSRILANTNQCVVDTVVPFIEVAVDAAAKTVNNSLHASGQLPWLIQHAPVQSDTRQRPMIAADKTACRVAADFGFAAGMLAANGGRLVGLNGGGGSLHQQENARYLFGELNPFVDYALIAAFLVVWRSYQDGQAKEMALFGSVIRHEGVAWEIIFAGINLPYRAAEVLQPVVVNGAVNLDGMDELVAIGMAVAVDAAEKGETMVRSLQQEEGL